MNYSYSFVFRNKEENFLNSLNYGIHLISCFVFNSGSTMGQKKANGYDMMQSMATTILSETTSGGGNNGLQDKGTLFTQEHANVIIHSEEFPLWMKA